MKKTVVPVLAIVVMVFAKTDCLGQNHKEKIGVRHQIVQFVFCSDVHFGLTKPVFRNKQDVTSAEVNAAMIEQMNSLPMLTLPYDDGVSGGKKIKEIDAVVITGDLCNRQEKGVQSAAKSWKQFTNDYVLKLHLLDARGRKAKLLLTPGNHDISNAIGYEKPMEPVMDKAAMVGIYNLAMQPAVAKTAGNYNHLLDKANYSRDFNGIHFIFVDGWPDSTERVWMGKDLQKIPKQEPVLLFTHAMPDVEARFFTNPNGDHSINPTDKFENLVNETFKDGTSTEDSAVMEHKGLVGFLQAHPNIKAYFHGHTNYTEFYNWTGPDNNINLPCFRVDSPMKGKYSAKDETKLSFELVTIDATDKKMTVRECLWNTNPANPFQKITWGISKTIFLR